MRLSAALSLLLLILAGCGSGGIGTLPGVLADLIDFDSDSVTGSQACGPIQLSPAVPDCPLDLVCFTSACEEHNVCYGTCGASKGKCDQTFFTDLMSICNRRFLLSDPNYTTCQSLALAYWLGVQTLGDGAFEATQDGVCYDFGFAPTATGVCCLTSEACNDAGTRAECEETAGIFFPFKTCEEFDCTIPANDACADAITDCEPVELLGTSGLCAGDQSTCDTEADDCADDSECLPDEHRCLIETDNRLATTDGLGTNGACAVSSVENLQADVWFSYVAPCDGRLTVRMCDRADYDAMLAVYGTNEPDVDCVCPPPSADLLACDDDFCGGGSVSAVVLDDVRTDACYSIRVGGWSGEGTASTAAQGTSELDIRMECEASPAD